MKNYKLFAIILGVMFIFSATTSANAQKVQQIVAEIPFEFSVRDKTFEPGKYVIARLNPNSDPAVLHLRRYDEKAQMIIPTFVSLGGNRRGSFQASLKFTRYGDHYFLSGVSNPSEDFNAEIKRSKKENKLAKEFGKQKTEITVGLLAEKK